MKDAELDRLNEMRRVVAEAFRYDVRPGVKVEPWAEVQGLPVTDLEELYELARLLEGDAA